MHGESDQLDPVDELSPDLRAAVECLKQRPVPEAAMQRALDRAARCGLSVRRAEHRVRQKAVLGFAAAVAVCLALGLWLWLPSDLWADVVKAVQAKPWIHGTLRGAKPGESREFWISTSRAVGGSRSAEEISYFDDRLRITHRYEPRKKILYRLPSYSSDLGQWQQLLEIFQGLFRGDAELNAQLSGLILKGQKRTQTEKDGRKWDEYELVFQIPSQPDTDARMTFVVDTQTRLPHSMRWNSPAGEAGEFDFDYPENGPVDIYALGVPKDAKLIDRVPTGDMTRILAGIEAGRDRFDDFHAVVIRDLPPDIWPGRGPGRKFPMAFLVWKKGARWRIEIGMAPALLESPVPPDKDKKEWVREACKKAVFVPLSVCDGKAIYRGDLGQGVTRGNWKLVATAQERGSEPELMRVMPASWCYPVTFNPPNDRTEEVVNLNPSEGPPNTILVTSRLVDMRGHDPARTLTFTRFWLDPMRGFAVVRQDSHHADPAMKPPTDEGFQALMDQWEQTPNGVWYPTRVGSGSIKDLKEKNATWYHFFLDFPLDMPDELFKPAKRSALTDRYPAGS
jgi:hypothetical protein